MKDNKLSTEAYKGVRDFYPEDMAVLRYILDTWSKTAETFGFERYDASILEPAELYKSKGAANEEIVNEQTYTFIDRGEREVTLRPEMTPTVARMVAGKRRELTFPIRWYSIPNLFRYERPQKGRLREHWQLNCDIFGVDHFTADVEIIALAYQTLIDFGATPEMFEIRVNNRSFMNEWYSMQGVTDPEMRLNITRLNDRKNKISDNEYGMELENILNNLPILDTLKIGLGSSDLSELDKETPLRQVIEGLLDLGIINIKLDKTLARGFDYYTGTIFEIFDISGENNRSLIGGGRYDNLTSMFSDEPISGIGFGMGDVTMRDFLTTHHLLAGKVPQIVPTLMIIPIDHELNLEAQKVAQHFRQRAIRTAVDISQKKIGKKIADAAKRNIAYVLIVGSDELSTRAFTLKNLTLETEVNGDLEELIAHLIAHS